MIGQGEVLLPPARCAIRAPPGGMFPLHGSAHKKDETSAAFTTKSRHFIILRVAFDRTDGNMYTPNRMPATPFHIILTYTYIDGKKKSLPDCWISFKLLFPF